MRSLRCVLAVCAALMVTGCGITGATGGARDRRGTAGELVVRRGDFTRRFLLTGELVAVRSEEILVPKVPRAQTSIRWIEANGARVTKGQRVVEFDNSTFLRELAEKRLSLRTAETDLDQGRAGGAGTMAEAEFRLDRETLAYRKAKADADVPEVLLPRREYEERQLALERARVALEKARESFEAAREVTTQDVVQRRIAADKVRRDIAGASAAIEALTVRAPLDGVLLVAEDWSGRQLQVGDSVWVGMTVLRIPDLREMRVEAELSDVDDGKIAVGMRARCTLDAYPDVPFTAVVSEIAPVAVEPEQSPLRRIFRVSLALEASDVRRMRPGMSVKAEIVTESRRGVLLAPRAALLEGTPPARALLAGGGEREVRIGPCSASECVVEGGLAENERLRARG
jgi:HlyD family secretion protein